jgi:hypothetical protein
MKQLACITQFIVNLNLVAAEQIDSWVDKLKITLAATSMGVGGIVLFRQTYSISLFIERYPHKVHPSELLFAHIAAWLMDNDSERFDQKDADIEVELDILDDETADIMVSIDFIEEIGIVEDPGGAILFNGQRWRLATPIIKYALSGDIAEPVDLVFGDEL